MVTGNNLSSHRNCLGAGILNYLQVQTAGVMLVTDLQVSTRRIASRTCPGCVQDEGLTRRQQFLITVAAWVVPYQVRV